MKHDAIPYWPAMLNKATAARYCSLTVAAFDRAVFIGTLPQPIAFGEKQLWHRKAIDDSLDALASGGDWRTRSPLYQAKHA